MNPKSYYSRARDEMIRATDTAWAPWFVVDSIDKRQAWLDVISPLLSHIPYERAPRDKPRLPKRQSSEGYKEPDCPYKKVRSRRGRRNDRAGRRGNTFGRCDIRSPKGR